MVKAVKGCLLEVEPHIKVLIEYRCKEYIVKNLDSTHILVKEENLDLINNTIQAYLDQKVFQPDTNK